MDIESAYAGAYNGRNSAEPLDLLALARNPHAPAAVLEKLVQTKGVKYAKEIRTSAGKNLERSKNQHK